MGPAFEDRETNHVSRSPPVRKIDRRSVEFDASSCDRRSSLFALISPAPNAGPRRLDRRRRIRRNRALSGREGRSRSARDRRVYLYMHVSGRAFRGSRGGKRERGEGRAAVGRSRGPEPLTTVANVARANGRTASESRGDGGVRSLRVRRDETRGTRRL